MKPDIGNRRQAKRWLFENINYFWPQFSRATRYVIRDVETGRYYGTALDSGLIWVFPLSNAMVDHFHSASIARRQFPWYVWVGNWIDCCLPKAWRKRLPYRLYEIMQVDIVYEEWQLHFPEFNDIVRSVSHTVSRA